MDVSKCGGWQIKNYPQSFEAPANFHQVLLWQTPRCFQNGPSQTPVCESGPCVSCWVYSHKPSVSLLLCKKRCKFVQKYQCFNLLCICDKPIHNCTAWVNFPHMCFKWRKAKSTRNKCWRRMLPFNFFLICQMHNKHSQVQGRQRYHCSRQCRFLGNNTLLDSAQPIMNLKENVLRKFPFSLPSHTHHWDNASPAKHATTRHRSSTEAVPQVSIWTKKNYREGKGSVLLFHIKGELPTRAVCHCLGGGKTGSVESLPEKKSCPGKGQRTKENSPVDSLFELQRSNLASSFSVSFSPFHQHRLFHCCLLAKDLFFSSFQPFSMLSWRISCELCQTCQMFLQQKEMWRSV